MSGPVDTAVSRSRWVSLQRVRATTFRFESCELDVARYTLSRDGEEVHVAPRVFDLLQHLLRNRARVVPKDELLDALWGSRFVSETALTTALRSVRAAIGDSGEEQRLIRTVHGRGYQFVGVVDARDDAGRVPGAGADPERQSIRFCTADDGTRIAWATTGSGPVLLKAANWLSHLDLEWRSPVWGHWVKGLAAELPGFCCFQFAISDDARFVAAYTGEDDQKLVYHRDRSTGITRIVSAPSGRDAIAAPSKLFAGVAISGDGRFVSFGSTAALAPGHFAGAVVFPSDVLVRDVFGAPELAPRLSGEARQRPSALRIRVDCGAAFCDGAITGQVTAQSSPKGAGKEIFDIQRATTYTPGGMSTVVALELAGGAAAVSRLEALLQDPAYREHSRMQLELQATGERGTKTASTTLLLAPDSLPAEPEPGAARPPGGSRGAGESGAAGIAWTAGLGEAAARPEGDDQTRPQGAVRLPPAWRPDGGVHEERLGMPRHGRDHRQAGETDRRAQVGAHREQLHLSDDGQRQRP